MFTTFSRKLPILDESKRLIISPQGKFAAFESNFPDGVDVKCGYCESFLIKGVHPTITLYRAAFQCPFCQNFSEINLLGDMRASSDDKIQIGSGSPLTGTIRLETPIDPKPNAVFIGDYNPGLETLDLREIRLELERFAQQQKEDLAHLEFYEKLLEIFHRFAFYCRQHSGTLATLDEEVIRDLCLLILKSIFGSASTKLFIRLNNFFILFKLNGFRHFPT